MVNFKFSLQPHKNFLHHTVWKTWLFIAYSNERWLCYQFSLPHLYIFQRLEECTFCTCAPQSSPLRHRVFSSFFFSSASETITNPRKPCLKCNTGRFSTDFVQQASPTINTVHHEHFLCYVRYHSEPMFIISPLAFNRNTSVGIQDRDNIRARHHSVHATFRKARRIGPTGQTCVLL